MKKKDVDLLMRLIVEMITWNEYVRNDLDSKEAELRVKKAYKKLVS